MALSSSMSAGDAVEETIIDISYDFGKCNYQDIPLMTVDTSEVPATTSTITAVQVDAASHAVVGQATLKLFNGEMFTIQPNTTSSQVSLCVFVLHPKIMLIWYVICDQFTTSGMISMILCNQDAGVCSTYNII